MDKAGADGTNAVILYTTQIEFFKESLYMYGFHGVPGMDHMDPMGRVKDWDNYNDAYKVNEYDNPYHTTTQTNTETRQKEFIKLRPTQEIKPKPGDKKTKKPTKPTKPIYQDPPAPTPPIKEPETRKGEFTKEEFETYEKFFRDFFKGYFEKMKKGATESAREAFDVDALTIHDPRIEAEAKARAEEEEREAYRAAFERERAAREAAAAAEAAGRAATKGDRTIEARIAFDDMLAQRERFRGEFIGREKLKYKIEPINFTNHKDEADEIRQAKQTLNSLMLQTGANNNRSRTIARLNTERGKRQIRVETSPVPSIAKGRVYPYGSQSYSSMQGPT